MSTPTTHNKRTDTHTQTNTIFVFVALEICMKSLDAHNSHSVTVALEFDVSV